MYTPCIPEQELAQQLENQRMAEEAQQIEGDVKKITAWLTKEFGGEVVTIIEDFLGADYFEVDFFLTC